MYHNRMIESEEDILISAGSNISYLLSCYKRPQHVLHNSSQDKLNQEDG